MIAPKNKNDTWEKVISRYLTACGLFVRWDGHAKRFFGVAGHKIVRMNPYAQPENIWLKMPYTLKTYEKQRNDKDQAPIIIVANRKYGDSVEDSIVVTRLGTFAPMLKAFVDSDPERNKE
jgi:hypothetical protein|tara:strand:- start:865 stop:1224 length:360 start_codon:yes stop_codon:yes gene_type:complete